MSNAKVTNPDEWHIYPAGAHHKLTECSPTLHYMIEEHRPDLQLLPEFGEPPYADVSAKKPSFPQHNTPISPDRVELTEEGVKIFVDDEELKYSQRQVEKIMQEVREGERKRLESLQELQKVDAKGDPRGDRPIDRTPAQEPHRCARFMLLQFFDGTDFRVDFQNPNFQGGWKMRKMMGVEMLIVGHGVPRQMFPLCNIKYMSLIPEDY